MKIKSLPQSERPVEKSLSTGVDSLSNSELLAVIIGSGTRHKSAISLAEDVLAKDERGIAYLTDCSAEELMAISGIGSFKAVRIMAAVELGKRISTYRGKSRVPVTGAEDIAKLFMESMRYEKREVFKAMLLNSKGEIISVETVSIGELTSTLVHPREVFHRAVRKSAAAMILVHNHPSGDPAPSQEDVDVTRRLSECGILLGIKIVDHIIVGDGQYCSLQSSGYM